MTPEARLVEPNNQAFLLSGQGAFAREVLVHPARGSMADESSRAKARAMVDKAIEMGLQPVTNANSVTGFAGVILTKNKWYQARIYDKFRKRQRAVPGLHEEPEDAALALAYAKTVLAAEGGDEIRLPSPNKIKKKPRTKKPMPAALPVAVAIAMPCASPRLPFATVQPLAAGYGQQLDPFSGLAEFCGEYSSPVP